jgi:hypothetical protein
LLVDVTGFCARGWESGLLFGGSVASVSVQQFINANPVLAIIVLFVVGIVLVLAARILLANAGCLLQLGCAVVIIVILFLLVRFLLFHF